ncbi:phage tail spike protein [Bacillus mycoides]|uniref:phage tail spike protein n=1 Tax=Bacillus mycoides TaxID=1405 RepID=UPI002E1BD7BD|nr:phage tail spike protein [Bacillus mycoides]MED1056949.1 phage tail spike protein [Bacillus mycoides]
MRTPSGDLHIVDFKTSQIVSDIQAKDYWDDKRHWEIKNNIDTLEFRVFENTEHAATLVQQNLVLKEVRGGRIVPYVITEVEKDSDDRSLMVYASGEWIQLAKAAIIEPQKIESKTLKQCMQIALKGTKWEIGKTEHDGAHSFTVDEFIDPLNLLKKIAASFELEIQYRAEVVGSQIVGHYVDMVKKRGRDTRKEVTLGKDLMGIKRIENSQNICTALLGYVKKENGEFITISEINNGVPYFVDDAAYQRWNEKGKHKFAFYTPQTEDQDMSPQRLMTLMKTEMNKLVNTSVSYEVRVQSIGRVFGLAHELINEGDTIRIIDTGFTPKLYLEARAIAGDESFKDPTQDKYVFGDYREIVDQNDELRRLYQKILSSLYDKVPQDLFDQLKDKVNEQNEVIIEAKDKADQAQKESQTAKDLAEATVDYVNQNLVDIIESVKPPTTDLKANKTLWRDISNGKPGILKIWTGTAWESVVPDVESVKKETLEQVTKDINNTKQELDKKVETLKTETETLVNTQIKEVQATLNDKVAAVKKDTETISGEILNIKKDVSGKVDGEFVKNQIKDKADKSGVFTKEEINNGFIGKQIYETDKQGNVKKFQEINTSVEQTNEAIKSKAEKQSVIDLGNNLTQVSKTANEAKQTADGNTRAISQVDSKVNQTATDFTKKTTAIEETVNGVSTKVTNIQTEQGKLSERVTKSEQTAEGFKKSIESLNTANGTTSNRLNKVEETVDGTKQTISDIQSEAASLKKTTNEIKQTADGTKQTLTQLKTQVDNTKVGGRNLLVKGDLEKTNSREYVKYADLAPIIDLHGLIEYTISFDIKVAVAGEVQVYMQNGNGAKYKFSKNVNATTQYERRFITVTPTLDNKTLTESWLSFYGTYDSGRFITVKNVKVEKGNVPTDYSPAPEEQVTTTDFTKKTVEIDTTIKGINTTVSNVQNEQGKLTERVTNSEQTANGFKQSIESLTKKDSEISNKLNTVESTVEGTKKTISDIQSDTNSLKQTTTEIKEQAGKVTEKLSSVEKKFDDMKIGGRNMLLNTAGTLKSDTGAAVSNSVNKTFQIAPDGLSMLQGQQFTISFKARTSGYEKGTPNPWAGVEIWVKYKDGEQVWPGVRCESTVSTNQEWKIYSFTHTLKDKNIEVFQPQTLLRNVKGMIELKEWQIEIGNKATDYTPAAEDQVTTNDFTKKTTEIEKSVDGVKTTVTSVQNSQAGFEKRVNTVEQTVDKNTQTITSLSTTQGKQGELIQSNKSSIEQLNNEINLRVTETQMEDYIGNIGHVNMVSNSAFEERTIHPTTGVVTATKPSIAKWEARATGATNTVIPVNARHHGGYNSVKIECSGLTDANFTGITQNMPIVSGSGAYIFSVWIYTDNASGIDEGGAIEMSFRNGSTQVSTKLTYFDKTLANNNWTQLSVKLDAPTQPANEVSVRLYVRKNGRVWLSQPMVVQGTELSTYMENPKDITNYDQLIGEVAKKVATSEYNQKVTTMETAINQNTKEISLKAVKEEVYTKGQADNKYGEKAMVVRHESEIKAQAEQITLRVKAGDINSTINQTAQSVLIQAQKINLVGAVTSESINSGILRGTQIYTNADTSGAYLKLEKQHLTLMNGTQPRGYFGFITRSDAGIQSALVLGNDYAVNKQLEGSLVIDQVTQGTAWTNAVASIGIASGGKTGNDINKSSYINFYRYMDKMEIRSQGPIEMNAIKGDITMRSNSSNGISIDSATYMNFNSNTATYLFNNGRDIVDKWTLKMFENGINSGDVDLNIGNQLTLRVARAYPYTMEGLQVKNNKGNDYAGVSCGTLTYGSLSQRSSRDLKTAIKDIEVIDVLETLMELQPRQYFMKNSMNELYAKRQEVIDGGYSEEMPTTKDVHQEYGFIAEEVPEAFATPRRKAVNMYPLITIGIAGTQEVYKKHLALEETVKEQATQLAMQEDRIARLEELLLQQLINKKPEQQ